MKMKRKEESELKPLDVREDIVATDDALPAEKDTVKEEAATMEQ